MGYSREIYLAAMQTLSQRRNAMRMQTERRRAELQASLPELFDLERKIASAGFEAARAVLGSQNVEADLERLMQENLRLQEQYNALLLSHGYPEDYLLAQYCCPACHDEGYCDGGLCECVKELMRQEAFRRLNELTPAKDCTFESFSLSYYPDEPLQNGSTSPRRQMETILRYCKAYADSFGAHSRSILMQGSTGLGKTHLSLAIARAAIDKGFGVIYGSVQNLMAKLEQERFGRGNEGESAKAMLECDLLILDDLGTEFTTQFVTASMYNLVNSRLLAAKPTIISTNLSMKDLNDKYTERFTSRIIGGYDRLVFLGRDIRQQKRQAR